MNSERYLYSALKVSRYIIAYETQKGRPINNLRLQKLLYFVQAQFLVERGHPIFDADIEAWSVGPVVPEAFHTFKFHADCEIPPRDLDYDLNWIHYEDRKSIDMILEDCSKYSTAQLIKITVLQDPWKRARHTRNLKIKNEDIKKFFE